MKHAQKTMLLKIVSKDWNANLTPLNPMLDFAEKYLIKRKRRH